MMAMLDFGEALIILSFKAREIVLKRSVCLMALVMSLLERLHLLGYTNGMLMIFRYDFDWGR